MNNQRNLNLCTKLINQVCSEDDLNQLNLEDWKWALFKYPVNTIKISSSQFCPVWELFLKCPNYSLLNFTSKEQLEFWQSCYSNAQFSPKDNKVVQSKTAQAVDVLSLNPKIINYCKNLLSFEKNINSNITQKLASSLRIRINLNKLLNKPNQIDHFQKELIDGEYSTLVISFLEKIFYSPEIENNFKEIQLFIQSLKEQHRLNQDVKHQNITKDIQKIKIL